MIIVTNMSLMSKIKNFFSFKDIDEELTPERTTEIIEKLAQIISKHGMEDVAGMYLSGFVPISRIFSELYLLPLSPFLELMGINGYEYNEFLNNKENVKRLIKRVTELKNKKKRGFWG